MRPSVPALALTTQVALVPDIDIDAQLTLDETDAAQLVTNANARAKGETPDRSAGRAAGMDINKKASSGKLQTADAKLIQQDLKDLQAAAQR